MTAVVKRIDWGIVGPVVALLGILMAVAGGWMSFESRITRAETQTEAIREDFRRLEEKIDRLIEREMK
jgi:hypothetical protein